MQLEVFIKNNNKHFYVETENTLPINEYIVVETPRGIEIAKVGRVVENQDNIIKYLRVATSKDKSVASSNEQRAKTTLPEVQKIMNDMGLGVKVILIEFTLDRKKMIISFASDNRIDFRELVKVLASKYRCKIEMRQIGFRDEMRIKGSVGMCGRECCCKRLTEFDKVSIKMAKNQNLSLGPDKISGVCGKLLCCLAYENEMYIELNSKMPKMHDKINTPDGEGVVVYNDVLNQRVHVKFEQDGYKVKDYALSEISF